MRIHYMTCAVCEKQMELGEEAFFFEGEKICENCLDKRLAAIIEEARFHITREDCDDFDSNEGC